MDVLSVNATESASYVREAPESYPDIEVTTISEVHAQLLGIGLADVRGTVQRDVLAVVCKQFP